MNDNNKNENLNDNLEENFPSTEVTNIIEKSAVEEELELDPEIVKTVSEDSSANENSTATVTDFFDEAMPPIMPQIEQNRYTPTNRKKASKGTRVFALILAFLMVASIFMTVGYIMGNNIGPKLPTPDVDLANRPSNDNALSVSQVFALVDKSVVGIYVYNSTGIASTASGVIYSKDGYVVTNDHIYSGVKDPKFKVYTSDGTMYSAKFIAGDTRSDLAVLKIENPGSLTPAIFGNSNELFVGETVIAVGRPNGATEDSIASDGVVSDKSRRVAITSTYSGNYIQTNTAINPGSSGGALCNVYGQVIGITSAKIVGDEYEGIGFAIPTTIMKKNVELLIEHKYVKGRAKLGISYIEIDALTAEISGSPAGLKIETIDESSPLYGTDAKVGDIITKVGGKDIIASSIMLDEIESKQAGDKLILTVYSTKRKLYFDVTAVLLEDGGGSNYNKSTTSSLPEGGNSNGENYNKDQFPFPNGD